MGPRVLRRDASCPNGGVFYKCNGGFVGCCFVEACNPGVGCPAGKDMTPTTSFTQNLSLSPTPTTEVAMPTRTASMPAIVSDLKSTLSLASPTAQATVTETSTFTTVSEIEDQHDSGNAISTTAIVGAVLGAVIIVAIIVGLFVYVRRRKRTKVYKAAVYPSPHVGSDMSPQLPAYEEPKMSRFAGLLGPTQKFAHHLDSREVVLAAEMGETLPRHLSCAELPASNVNVHNV